MNTPQEYTVTITLRLSATPPAGTTTEDILECVQAGLISLRDNSLPLAHIENHTTGEQHPITIDDFTFGTEMRGE